jgi:hypothetical protein
VEGDFLKVPYITQPEKISKITFYCNIMPNELQVTYYFHISIWTVEKGM